MLPQIWVQIDDWEVVSMNTMNDWGSKTGKRRKLIKPESRTNSYCKQLESSYVHSLWEHNLSVRTLYSCLLSSLQTHLLPGVPVFYHLWVLLSEITFALQFKSEDSALAIWHLMKPRLRSWMDFLWLFWWVVNYTKPVLFSSPMAIEDSYKSPPASWYGSPYLFSIFLNNLALRTREIWHIDDQNDNNSQRKYFLIIKGKCLLPHVGVNCTVMLKVSWLLIKPHAFDVLWFFSACFLIWDAFFLVINVAIMSLGFRLRPTCI